MTSRLANLTFDSHDPLALAGFWSGVLDQPVDEGASEFFATINQGPSSDGPTWMFLAVEEGKTAKNRLHLDIETEDPDTEIPRLLDLGATRLADKAEWGHTWTIMADPEGNEFCVSKPHM